MTISPKMNELLSQSAGVVVTSMKAPVSLIIHDEGFTLLVRQLPPGPEGLPIELYCFSNDQDWVRFEGEQDL